MALLHADLPNAERLLLQALEISRQPGDKRQAAWALISIIVLGKPNQANTFAEEGLALFREFGNQPGTASAFNALGKSPA